MRTGLQKLKKDKRDWSHHLTFGAFDMSQIPDEYNLVSTILDQGATDQCTAYTASAIKESQSGMCLDPQWFFDQEGATFGTVSEYGYDLRTQMKTGCQKGFKPLNSDVSPESFKEDSFFAIDGPRDL